MFGAKAKDREFFDAFTKHAAVCVEANKRIVLLFEDLANAKVLAKEIHDLEHQGDTITHETVKRLHETWITPLERGDIHHIITSLDDVLDLSEAVAERVLLFGVKKTRPTASALAAVLLKASECIAKAMAILPEVSTRGEEILELGIELNRLENEGDQLYRKGLGELFNRRVDGSTEPPPGPEGSAYRTAATPDDVLDVMKWREIYDYLENATDKCEDIANILEGIVLEYG